MMYRDTTHASELHTRKASASGTCPYCSCGFDRHELMDVCQAVECDQCHRWFMVRTHIEVSYTTHRVEGEVSRLRMAA